MSKFYRKSIDGGEQMDLRSWLPVYTKILVLVQKGVSVRDIARSEEIGLDEAKLRKIMRSPTFRLRMTRLSEKMDNAIIEKATEEISKTPEVDLARIRLLESAESAAKLLLRLMNPRSELQKKYSIHERRLMASIAQDVLDRAGLSTTTPADEGVRGRDYSPEEIQSALANAKELEQISGRLSSGDSSYVLTREQRDGAETTAALAPTDATEPEGVPLETPASEETLENEGGGTTPTAFENEISDKLSQ